MAGRAFLPWSSVVVVLAAVTALVAASAGAQVCDPAPGFDIQWIGGLGFMDKSSNCSRFSLYSRCYPAEPQGPRYEVTPGGCDPQQQVCTVRGILPIELPGNHQNPFEPCCSPALVDWFNSAGGVVAFCGFSFAQIRDGEGDARITAGGFSCADPSGLDDADVYTIIVTTCPGDTFGCEKVVEAQLELTPEAVAAALCAPEPAASAAAGRARRRRWPGRRGSSRPTWPAGSASPACRAAPRRQPTVSAGAGRTPSPSASCAIRTRATSGC